jgi:Arc/MetJ family transcription regulator
MGRLTVVLDDALLEDARVALGTKTKRETLESALIEAIRRARLRTALQHRGSLDLGFTRDDLLHRREQP